MLYLAKLITGNDPNPTERIYAASDLVEKYRSGDLDSGTALELMDTIAPGLAISERRKAAAGLARLSQDDDWDHDDRMAAGNELFRLVTGVPFECGGADGGGGGSCGCRGEGFRFGGCV